MSTDLIYDVEVLLSRYDIDSNFILRKFTILTITFVTYLRISQINNYNSINWNISVKSFF